MRKKKIINKIRYLIRDISKQAAASIVADTETSISSSSPLDKNVAKSDELMINSDDIDFAIAWIINLTRKWKKAENFIGPVIKELLKIRDNEIKNEDIKDYIRKGRKLPVTFGKRDITSGDLIALAIKKSVSERGTEEHLRFQKLGQKINTEIFRAKK
jgi:hypothetical protein